MKKRISLGGGAAIYVDTPTEYATPQQVTACEQPGLPSPAPLPAAQAPSSSAPAQQTLFAATRERYGD